MRTFILALLLPATTASAMIDPCSQEQMITAAISIVQVGDISVGPADADSFDERRHARHFRSESVGAAIDDSAETVTASRSGE